MGNFYLCIEKLGKLFQFISIHLLATSSYQKSFKLSVLFIVMISLSCFKAEAVIGALEKYLLGNVAFVYLLKLWEMPIRDFISLVHLLVPPACIFTKR